MKTNYLLIVLGTIIFMTGLYRTQKNVNASKLFYQVTPLLVVLALMAVGLFLTDGLHALRLGFDNALATTSKFLPTIIALFLVMGASAAITKYYKSQIETMVAGKYGVAGALGASIITPSSSTLAPQVTELWPNRSMRVNLMIYLVTCTQLSLSLLFFRNMGLNWEISGKMYAVGLVGSLLTIPVVRLCAVLGFL